MAIGAQVLGDAYVNIMGETSKLEMAFARAEQMANGFVRNIGKTIAVGIGAAMATAVGTGVGAFWMWTKEEDNIRSLEGSIIALGGNLDELIPRYEKIASMIQQNTTIGDTATRTAMAYAAALGAPVDRLDEVAVMAAGLAEIMGGIDIKSATRYLTMGLASGDFTMMRRYIPELRTAVDVQEQMNIVLEKAKQGFEIAKIKADTFASRVKALGNNLGDAMEALGKFIAEQLGLKDLVREFDKRFFRIAQVIQDHLGWGVKGVAKDFTEIGEKFEAFVIKITAFASMIPDIIKEVKKIWTGMEPGSFVTMFGSVMKETASLFVKVVLEGLKGLIYIFEGLGAVIVNAIKLGLHNIPYIGEKIRQGHAEEIARKEIAAHPISEPEMLSLEAMKEKQLRIKEMFDRRVEELLKNDNLIRAFADETKDTIKSGFLKAGEALKGSAEKLGVFWDEYKIAVSKATEKGTGVSPEEIKKTLQKIYAEHLEEWKKRFGEFALTEEAPPDPKAFDLNQTIEKGLGAPRAEITGFADWWRKTQQAAMEKKDNKEKEIADNTKEIAMTAKEANALLHRFYGISRPVFAEG